MASRHSFPVTCLVMLGLFGCASGTQVEDETSSDALSAEQCRKPEKADLEECKLSGTVMDTFMEGTRCIVYVRDQQWGNVYGLVEDASCKYTRAFHGITPAPFNKVWTRFADTQVIPTAEQQTLLAGTHEIVKAYYRLTGELRGELPDPAKADFQRAMANAITPLGGPNPALTTAIQPGDAPAKVKTAFEQAAAEIRARRFGNDYSADVQGYYTVYDSPAKSRIIAYAVYGTGAGEPDYHDGIIIGFDAEGQRVYDETDSG